MDDGRGVGEAILGKRKEWDRSLHALAISIFLNILQESITKQIQEEEKSWEKSFCRAVF